MLLYRISPRHFLNRGQQSLKVIEDELFDMPSVITYIALPQ